MYLVEYMCQTDFILKGENNMLQDNNQNVKNNKIVNATNKNPALLEVERRMWIKNSTLPQWIKDKVLNKDNSKGKI